MRLGSMAASRKATRDDLSVQLFLLGDFGLMRPRGL